MGVDDVFCPKCGAKPPAELPLPAGTVRLETG